MFGYVTINQDELKVKDYLTYRSFYCGVCRCLSKHYGLSGHITLNYDLTFLALLLTGLYEAEGTTFLHRCALHPTQKREQLVNEFTEYAADMTILLSYYQCMDQWQDEKKVVYRAEAMLLKKNWQKISARYPRQRQAVDAYIHTLTQAEAANSDDLDLVAGSTGTMLAEIFVYKEDEWSDVLRQIGFFLGKFIYLMDAYEDIERDLKNNCYNPFHQMYLQPDFHAQAEAVLTTMMAECARRFERLPILLHVDIMRNILYSGVWSKYEALQQKRQKENEHGSI